MTYNLFSSFPYYGKIFLQALKYLQKGSMTFKTPCGQTFMFKSQDPYPHVTFEVLDWSTIKRMMSEGEVGFAKDYFNGKWRTNDLPNLLYFGLLNEQTLKKFLFLKGIKRWYYRFKHLVRPNSREGSRKNIHLHYDISNDFFKSWLDPSMTYSSGIFEKNMSQTLEQAQKNKFDRILKCLDLPKGSSLLEIGCGWGSFMEYAHNRNYAISGLTISREQYNFVQKKLSYSTGIYAKTIYCMDYRDIKGQYNGIVSIEMFESIGQKYWPTFFKTLKKNLLPQGKIVIQTILIDNNFFDRYQKNVDSIQMFIFPGGMLPCEKEFCLTAKQAGLKVHNIYKFGHDYAETARRWLQKFDQQINIMIKQGYSQEFINMWRYYLSYCIAGFQQSRINVAQFELHHD